VLAGLLYGERPTPLALTGIVLGERLTGLRLAGLGLAGVCVSLIAVGGAG
jgi:hypothetical protein